MAERTLNINMKFAVVGRGLVEAERGARKAKAAMDDANKASGGFGSKARAAMGQVGKAGQGLGTVLGAAGVAGIVASLTSKFIELAATAKARLDAIKEEAVSLNEQFEQSQIVFENIFGDKETAEAFIEGLRSKSVDLGIAFSDASQFAKSLLPDTGSMAEFNQLLTIAATGARDANLPLQELIFSFNELASGDLTSIRDRLDIPKDVVNRIKAAGQSTGNFIGPAIEELGVLFEKRGIDIESFADSYQASMDKAAASTDSLKLALGDSIFDQRKESMNELTKILEENGEEYTLIAARVGDVVAAIEEFVSSGLTDFLGQIDNQKVLDLLDAFFELVEAGKLLGRIIFGTTEDFDLFNSIIEFATQLIREITAATQTLSQILAMSRAGWAGIGAAITNVDQQIQEYLGLIDEAQTVDPMQAVNESLLRSVKAFEQHDDALKQDIERQRERREEIDKTVPALESFEGTLLATRKAEEEAAKAAAKYEAAQAKIAETTEKVEEGLRERLQDLHTQQTRQNLDMLQDFARKREDIERKNAQRIVDIHRDFKQDQIDAAKDLSREEQDIARDFSRKRAELERKGADDRADIEKEHQQRLRGIKSQFEQQTEDAVRNQDAIAFVRAQEQANNAIAEAEREKEEKHSLKSDELAEEKAALEIQRQQAMEDAKIENSRRLEDLRDRLEQELAENQQKLEREREEQLLAEKRKQEDLAQSFEQQNEDFRLHLQRKKDDLLKSLEEEYQLVKDFEAKKQAEIEKSKVAKATAKNARLASGNPNDPTFLTPNSQRNNAEAARRTEVMANLAAGGGFSGGSFSYSQQNTFNDRDDSRVIAAQLKQQTMAQLRQFARGH